MGRLGLVSRALDRRVSKKPSPGRNPGCPAAGSHAPQYAASPKDHGPSYPATPRGAAETTNLSSSSLLFPPNARLPTGPFRPWLGSPAGFPTPRTCSFIGEAACLPFSPRLSFYQWTPGQNLLSLAVKTFWLEKQPRHSRASHRRKPAIARNQALCPRNC